MATPPSKQIVQDLPPRSGFPAVGGYRRPRFTRGPPGVVIVGTFCALTAYGMYRQVNAKKEQRYDNWAAFARRYERAYLVQAKNKVQTAREAARIMDSEREIMAAVPGWTAGKSPYYTQPQVPRVIFKPNLPEEAK